MSDGHQLRHSAFGWIPKEWNVKSLDEVCEIIQDGTHFSPKSKSGPWKYLTSRNVREGRLDLSEVSYICDAEHRSIYARCPVRIGDILLTKDGAKAGAAAPNTLDEEFSLLSSVALLRGKESEITNQFLLQVLMSQFAQLQVRRAVTGQAITRLTLETIKLLLTIVPSLPEQKGIVEILACHDSKKRCLENLLIKKAERKRGLMQQLLSGKTRLGRFKDAPWRLVPLSELLEAKNRYETWDDSRLFRLAGVRRNGGGLFFRDELAGAEIKVKTCKKIRAGDFLISRRQMTYGGMAMVPPEFDGFDVNDEYEVLVIRDGARFDMRFFNYLSQTPELKYAALVASNGFFAERLRLNLDLEQFLSHRIAVPPSSEELQSIVSVLDAAAKEIDLLEKQLTALKEQKRGLVQKLLTGEVRVKG